MSKTATSIPITTNTAPVSQTMSSSGAAAAAAANQEEYSKYQALFDSIPQTGLKCDVIFLVIKNRIREEPEYVKRLRVVFQFNITKNQQHAATWTCDTKSCIEGDIYRSTPKEGIKPDCILTVDDDDWVRIMVGKLNPQRAFMMSKFKIKGNIMLLQKLHSLWYEMRRAGKTPELDMIQEIMVEEPLLPGLKSEVMAIEIVQRIVKAPHLVEKVDANIQVNVTKQGQMMTKYLIGMHPNKKLQFRRLFNGLAGPNSPDHSHSLEVSLKPDVIFTIEDDDLVLIIYGIYKVGHAIATGRLQVEGKFDLVERATALFEQAPIMARL